MQQTDREKELQIIVDKYNLFIVIDTDYNITIINKNRGNK